MHIFIPSPYPIEKIGDSPYPIEKIGDSPYPYPYPVNEGIPRQNGHGFGQYLWGWIYLLSLINNDMLEWNFKLIIYLSIYLFFFKFKTKK